MMSSAQYGHLHAVTSSRPPTGPSKTVHYSSAHEKISYEMKSGVNIEKREAKKRVEDVGVRGRDGREGNNRERKRSGSDMDRIQRTSRRFRADTVEQNIKSTPHDSSMDDEDKENRASGVTIKRHLRYIKDYVTTERTPNKSKKRISQSVSDGESEHCHSSSRYRKILISSIPRTPISGQIRSSISSDSASGRQPYFPSPYNSDSARKRNSVRENRWSNNLEQNGCPEYKSTSSVDGVRLPCVSQKRFSYGIEDVSNAWEMSVGVISSKDSLEKTFQCDQSAQTSLWLTTCTCPPSPAPQTSAARVYSTVASTLTTTSRSAECSIPHQSHESSNLYPTLPQAPDMASIYHQRAVTLDLSEIRESELSNIPDDAPTRKISAPVPDADRGFAWRNVSRISRVSRISLREQTSTGCLPSIAGAGGMDTGTFHSTFNYPLHSTLQQPGAASLPLSPVIEYTEDDDNLRKNDDAGHVRVTTRSPVRMLCSRQHGDRGTVEMGCKTRSANHKTLARADYERKHVQRLQSDSRPTLRACCCSWQDLADPKTDNNSDNSDQLATACTANQTPSSSRGHKILSSHGSQAARRSPNIPIMMRRIKSSSEKSSHHVIRSDSFSSVDQLRMSLELIRPVTTDSRTPLCHATIRCSPQSSPAWPAAPRLRRSVGQHYVGLCPQTPSTSSDLYVTPSVKPHNAATRTSLSTQKMRIKTGSTHSAQKTQQSPSKTTHSDTVMSPAVGQNYRHASLSALTESNKNSTQCRRSQCRVPHSSSDNESRRFSIQRGTRLEKDYGENTDLLLLSSGRSSSSSSFFTSRDCLSSQSQEDLHIKPKIFRVNTQLQPQTLDCHDFKCTKCLQLQQRHQKRHKGAFDFRAVREINGVDRVGRIKKKRMYVFGRRMACFSRMLCSANAETTRIDCV